MHESAIDRHHRRQQRHRRASRAGLRRAGRTLALTGRDEARLAGVAERCRGAGATVTAARVDAADREAMAGWLREIDAAAPIDLMIANAGIASGTPEGREDPDLARRTFDVNLTGVLNSLQPLVEPMIARRRGQLVIISSLAVLPRLRRFAPPTAHRRRRCASGAKACATSWPRHGVEVNVVCPGFVVSRMTAVNKFRMPFLMETAAAAAIIKRGLAAE